MKINIALSTALMLVGAGLMFSNCFEAVAQTKPANLNHPRALSFVGGQIFDGERFVRRDIHIADGVFVEKQTSEAVDRFEVHGQFLTLAFAEAHCHTLRGGEQLWEQSKAYRKQGVLYALSLNNPSAAAEEYREGLTENQGIDALFANGGFTRTECHPIPLYRRIHTVFQKKPEDTFIGTAENNVFFIVNDQTELEKKWPTLLKSKPDFIKVYMLFSETYETGQPFKGLDPKLVEEIVRKAHQQKLRVAAHIETAKDFENAVKAGVDFIGHLPYLLPNESEIEDFLIPSETATVAAQRRIAIATTSIIPMYNTRKLPVADSARISTFKMFKANLKTIRDANVRLVIGSDGNTPFEEAKFLASLNVYTSEEILKAWTMTTPLFLFPNRKVGSWDAGAEGTLVVLDGNPLEDWNHAQEPSIVVQRGSVIINRAEER